MVAATLALSAGANLDPLGQHDTRNLQNRLRIYAGTMAIVTRHMKRFVQSGSNLRLETHILCAVFIEVEPANRILILGPIDEPSRDLHAIGLIELPALAETETDGVLIQLRRWRERAELRGLSIRPREQGDERDRC